MSKVYKYSLTEIYSKQVDIIETTATKDEFAKVLNELKTLEDYSWEDIQFLLERKGFTYHHLNGDIDFEFSW